MAENRSTGPLVVINIHNFGHFMAYVDNVTRWGLSRELPVVILGSEATGTVLGRKYAQVPAVDLLDVRDFVRPDREPPCLRGPSQARDFFVARWRELVAAACERLAPRAVVLVNADELFFEPSGVENQNVRFAAPVYGVVTFGHRETILGVEEPYARRLNVVLRERRVFAGLLSIDEEHVLARDPGENFLTYLPDLYREFAPESPHGLPARARDACAGLADFLTADRVPVVPVLGKFDRRKGNLWILRAVLAQASMKVVILGERIPDPAEDGEIDAILARLAEQGRLYARFGFAPEEALTAVLGSGRVPFVPLAYRGHFGSSGIELMAHEFGLPVLAPDYGLVGQRTAGHGLGEVFRPGSFEEFSRKFARLLAQGPAPYARNISRFMSGFGPGPAGAALDRTILGRTGAASPLAALAQPPFSLEPAGVLAKAAQLFLTQGDIRAALARLDEAVALDPLDPMLRLRRATVLWRRSETAKAGRDLAACLAAGLVDEVAMVTRLVADQAYDLVDRGKGEDGARGALSWLAALPGEASAGALSGVTQLGLEAGFFRTVGVVFAKTGHYDNGVRFFEQAMRLDPDNLEYPINLADVLRYAGRYQESLTALDRFEAARPGAPGIACKRGQAAMLSGDAQAAKLFFLLEAPDSPYYQAARNYLGQLETN